MVNNKELIQKETANETYESTEKMKYPKEFDDGAQLKETIWREMKRMTLRFKQCLNDLHIINYPSLYSVETTFIYHNEVAELMVIAIIYPDQTILEMFKNLIKTKQVWICHFKFLKTY